MGDAEAPKGQQTDAGSRAFVRVCASAPTFGVSKIGDLLG